MVRHLINLLPAFIISMRNPFQSNRGYPLRILTVICHQNYKKLQNSQSSSPESTINEESIVAGNHGESARNQLHGRVCLLYRFFNRRRCLRNDHADHQKRHTPNILVIPHISLGVLFWFRNKIRFFNSFCFD
jgi:hypothetical protein